MGIRIQGGDTLQMIDGKEIKVADINDRFVFAANGDIYLISEVVKVIERYRKWKTHITI